MASRYVTERQLQAEFGIEATAHHDEDLIFVDFVRQGAYRALRLIEGGRGHAAHQTLSGVAYAADRRARQLAVDPESAA